MAAHQRIQPGGHRTRPVTESYPARRSYSSYRVALSVLVFTLVIIAFTHSQISATITRLTFGPSRPHPSVLRFDSLEAFKISIFSDLHFGEAESTTWGPEQDFRTLKVMSKILDTEFPDLVVLNGDLITGEDTFLDNATDYFNKLATPMVTRNVRWASTYGNHDNGFTLSAAKILEREKVHTRLSLTQQMVTGDTERVGVTNYFVPVYAVDRDEPAAILWFFDSRGGLAHQRVDGHGKTIQLPGVVDPAVTEWFTRTARNLRIQHGGRMVPSIAFVHIPVSAMSTFQQDGVDGHRQPGINDDVPLASQHGDEAFLNTLRDEGVHAVFSGHDHGNDWCMPRTRDGSTLFACFGRHTGYGGYGHWMRGSRQILLNTQGEVETWVRLEDGDVSGRVRLNETYGQDIYPEVKKAYTSLGVDSLR